MPATRPAAPGTPAPRNGGRDIARRRERRAYARPARRKPCAARRTAIGPRSPRTSCIDDCPGRACTIVQYNLRRVR
ncbi:hypothetical protein BURPS1710A_A1719 [Burkholderia pseudomallei 1710a]|uniref:Uncharacterized protein n=1 Tax=Burkholderia pseudomallei 1710a TaxID=320371 RepID=A0A0E1VTQ6_BURPE|nr:hypothetical protein BURPS1710A_A1719 [Burkholderia pseudomallei 1710a]